MPSPPQTPTQASVPRRVWRGTSFLVLGRVYGSACTFAQLWLLAHHLAPDAFGRYTFYLAVFVFLDALVDFGTGQVAVQRTAADESRMPEVLAGARRVRLATGNLGVLLVGGGALWMHEPAAGWILVASLYPVTHVAELSTVVLRNRIAWGIPVGLRAVAATTSFLFVLALRATGDHEPAHYLCAVAAGSAIANGLLYLACRRHLPARAATEVPWASVLAAAAPLGFASLCQQAYFYADNLFVRAMRGEAELGAYNVGVRILSMTIMVALYASQAALPWLARQHSAGRLGESAARLGQPLFAAAGLVAGLAAPWAAQILGLFGAHVAIAGPSLRWLFGAVAVIHAGAVLTTSLVAAGRGRSMLGIAAIGLALNLAANSILIPRFGIEGAGMATLITEISVAVGAAWVLARTGARAAWRAWGWIGGPVGFAAGFAASAAILAGSGP
ncbi:MAG: oligosaccharide flippase family protein [Planctomycetota bacterium]|nr:oligosaccharide flippase family protein [Planctomycetota bacterium]